MSFFVLSAVLTNAGSSLIAAAKLNGLPVEITAISFGDYAGAITAASTSIGNVLETAGYVTSAANILKTSAEFQCIFNGQSSRVGTFGVYSGATLICLVRFTMPNSVVGGVQVSIRLATADAIVFSSPAATVGASVLGELYKKAYDDSQEYLQNGAVFDNRAFFGNVGGKESDWFCDFVNIINSQADFNLALSNGAVNGTVAYYVLDGKRYAVVGGVWVVQTTGLISDVIKPGRFYRSDITKSLYYARSATNLLKVFSDPSTKIDLVLKLTTDAMNKHAQINVGDGVQLDYYFDNAPTPIRVTATGTDVVQPAGATIMYIKFVPATVTPVGSFSITNNDIVESVLDWSEYSLTKLSLARCRRLKTVPTNALPSNLNSLADMFNSCGMLDVPSLNWDTVKITNMNNCFGGCISFNGDLPWNTSNCTGFASMFSGAAKFNKNINAWNTAKGTSMSAMFANAVAFNQPLNNWDVRNCGDLTATFMGAIAFNQSLDNWRPAANLGVRTLSCVNTFNGAANFAGPIVNWMHNRIAKMNGMFANATNFRENLYSWQLPADLPRTGYDSWVNYWIDSMKPRFIL